MEQISQALEQLQMNSQPSLPDVSKKKEISVYGEGRVTSDTLALCIIRIKKSFPDLPTDWFDMLEQMLDFEKFTDQRLIDATWNLIKTCVYPKPTIAQIINYDRTKKSYTYGELLEITKDFSPESRKKFFQKFDFKEGRYIEK